MTRDTAIELIRASPLAAYEDYLVSKLLPGVQISASPVDDLPLGASRFGGSPDLPKDVAWPQRENGTVLSFLAQINLAEIPLADGLLPQDGWLCFFYDMETWGAGAGDFDSWRVAHVPADAKLARRAAPNGTTVSTPVRAAFPRGHDIATLRDGPRGPRSALSDVGRSGPPR